MYICLLTTINFADELILLCISYIGSNYNKTIIVRYILIILFTFSSIFSFSQKIEGIKNPKNPAKSCKKSDKAFASLPQEVSFGLSIDGNKIYMVFSDYLWFDEFFKSPKDGIAVDLMSKSMFECGKQNKLASNWLHEGYLIKPVYRKQLKENIASKQGNMWIIYIGQVPEHLQGTELEAVMLLLQKNCLCETIYFYSLPSYRWELLDMGLYKDRIVYKDSLASAFQTLDSSMLNRKKMVFEFGFEKDKFNYSAEELKPLYDSLKLTDYDIESIHIKAYSSVEGSEERNIGLQEKRAESIVSALQAYQSPQIKTVIEAEENWSGFFSDIKNTGFAHYANKSKDEIKDSLEIDRIEASFDSLLRRHRKAVLQLELVKKDSLFLHQPQKLIKQFNKAIADSSIQKAETIQNALYHQICNRAVPSEFADSLELPIQKDYWQMYNNNYIYRALTDSLSSAYLLEKYRELDKLMPDNKQIKYNICALKFKEWAMQDESFDHEAFEKEIKGLSRHGIDKKLITRMLINYNIVMSEIYMLRREYRQKDKAMRFVVSNYRQGALTDGNLLDIAQYFVSYGNLKSAIKVVESRAYGSKPSEQLLFYYLGLTITEEYNVRSSKYRKVLNKAYDSNPERFCNIFSSPEKGGISFQLLRYKNLKSVYCKRCSESH